MTKTLLTIITLFYSIQTFSRGNILDPNGSLVKACTVHGTIYEVIVRQQECSFNVDHVSVNIPFTVQHEVLEPHNPECFDSHPL